MRDADTCGVSRGTREHSDLKLFLVHHAEAVGPDVDTRRPLETMRESWEVIRRLLAADTSGLQGNRFQLPEGARLRYELERPEVPLLVGTWSPRLGLMTRL